MTQGKQTCKILKEIRQQIADKNNIEYITEECNFQGECKGTCPKCEAELRHLENELSKRRYLGKAVVIAGISLGIAGTFVNCKPPPDDVSVYSTEGIAPPPEDYFPPDPDFDTIPVVPDEIIDEKIAP